MITAFFVLRFIRENKGEDKFNFDLNESLDLRFCDVESRERKLHCAMEKE